MHKCRRSERGINGWMSMTDYKSTWVRDFEVSDSEWAKNDVHSSAQTFYAINHK